MTSRSSSHATSIRQLAGRFISRAHALSVTGKRRDDLAVEYFVGAAVGAELSGDIKLAELIARNVALVIASRGYAAIEDLARDKTLTVDEIKSVMTIARRAELLAATPDFQCRPRPKAIDFAILVEAVNEKLPLDLARLATATDVNFAHDVFGILGNFEADTGELRDGFTPRHAISDAERRARSQS